MPHTDGEITTPKDRVRKGGYRQTWRGGAPAGKGVPIAVTGKGGDRRETMRHRGARWFLLAFAWLNVGLGLVGAVVPGMPTTVFLIIATGAFSKSSERFRLWLWNHPGFGFSIRAWHQHRVIPRRAKVAAAIMMAASFAFVTPVVAESWVLPVLLGAVLVPAAAYGLGRAGSVPPGGP